MIIDPYLSTYGKVQNIAKLTQAVKEYLVKTDLRNLNYEYKQYDECNIVFITGCDELEKEIPPFNNPLILQDIKGKTKVAVDVRQYLTKLDEQPLDLRKVAKDLGNLDFCAYRAIVTAGLVCGYFGYYKKYARSLTAAYGFLISFMIDNIVKLNPAEKINVELAAGYFLLQNFVPEDEFGNRTNESLIHNNIIANLSKVKFSFPVNIKFIEELTSRFLDIEYTGTVDNLLEYVKRALQNEKSQLINKNTFLNLCGNMWYGHGKSETMIIGLEHLPTWFVLVYSGLSNTSFKRFHFGSILSKYSSKIDANTFIKEFQRDMESHNE